MKPQQICKILEKAIEIYRDGSIKMFNTIEFADVNQYRVNQAFSKMDKSMEILEKLKNKLTNEILIERKINDEK